MGTALIQVLGAVAYGERKAYDEARVRATGSADAAERRAWRQVAAEELRHHKGSSADCRRSAPTRSAPCARTSRL